MCRESISCALAVCLLLSCGVERPAGAGTVTGTIKFEGQAPRFRPIRMGADPVCESFHSEPVLPQTLVLGEGQTMGNVLVSVTKGLPRKTYPVPDTEAVFTQAGCMYSPHVLAVRAGQKVRVLNPDGTLHNVHALSKINPEFNKAMSKSRKELIQVFRKAEPAFHIKCEVHPWMGAWCAVFDHPFFDVTDKSGTFVIEGLEAGTYEIKAWHERLGTQTASVTIAGDETKTVDFSFSRAEQKR